MSKVITIGEILIDFIPSTKGISLSKVESFVKKPGGAPANVAVAVSRLGGNADFIGKVGQDGFGEFLIETLKTNHVGVSGIVQTNEAKTALAFVTLSEAGERDFSFYRNPSADMLLNEDEIQESQFLKGDILHFCSVDLIEAPVKYAHLKAIQIAKEKGCLISFDPNVRLPLWETEDACRKTILEFLKYADILKLSQEELGFLTNEENEKKGLIKLQAFCKKKAMIIVTKGGKGVSVYRGDAEVMQPAFKIQVRDTTGAGDSFIGAYLYQVLELTKEINAEELVDFLYYLDADKLKEILKFSNAVGAITTMKEGAISALPTMEAVKLFLK